MKEPQKHEFEGARRTVAEIQALVGVAMPKKTIRDRLAGGQKTIAELRRPKPRAVNTAWNNSLFGKGHTA